MIITCLSSSVNLNNCVEKRQRRGVNHKIMKLTKAKNTIYHTFVIFSCELILQLRGNQLHLRSAHLPSNRQLANSKPISRPIFEQ